MAQQVAVKNGVKVKRIRFFVDIVRVKEDYRPLYWPYPHPYWCSGESATHFILVAYAESEEQLKQFWPEAEQIDIMESDLTEYTFTGRFAKPDWFEV